MKIPYFRILILALTTGAVALLFNGKALAQDKNRVARLAKIVIDTTHLEQYKAALAEEIESSVRLEPGVLLLNAVFEKELSNHITIMEVYANEAAYQSHLQTSHFKKYKSITANMVKNLELVDVIPIALQTKSNR